MKNPKLSVIVAWALLLLPSALALNCTLYYGNNRNLCNAINPLSISESDKLALMKPNVYGQIPQSTAEENLSLNLGAQNQISFSQIYEQNIYIAVRMVLLVFGIYSVFSIMTKHSRWLPADY